MHPTQTIHLIEILHTESGDWCPYRPCLSESEVTVTRTTLERNGCSVRVAVFRRSPVLLCPQPPEAA